MKSKFLISSETFGDNARQYQQAGHCRPGDLGPGGESGNPGDRGETPGAALRLPETVQTGQCEGDFIIMTNYTALVSVISAVSSLMLTETSRCWNCLVQRSPSQLG